MAELGRPPKYKTPEELERLIDLYFIACKLRQLPDDAVKANLLQNITDEELSIISDIDDVFPTVTGLAVSLGMTRKGLIDYENKDNPAFGNAIKKAKARVESFVEQRLYHANATGSIFNLKNNFGWQDKQDVNLGGQSGNPVNMTVSLPPEDRVVLDHYFTTKIMVKND